MGVKNKLSVVAIAACLLSGEVLAKKEIIIDLSSQTAYAVEDGEIAFEGRISSGRVGMETPTGVFKISQKKVKHKSNLWPKPNGGASMPFMMRLSGSAIALHLGNIPNKPASHGCIRLKKGFAQQMYSWAKVGTKVTVEGDADNYEIDDADYYYKQVVKKTQKKKHRSTRRAERAPAPSYEIESFEMLEYYEDELTGVVELH